MKGDMKILDIFKRYSDYFNYSEFDIIHQDWRRVKEIETLLTAVQECFSQYSSKSYKIYFYTCYDYNKFSVIFNFIRSEYYKVEITDVKEYNYNKTIYLSVYLPEVFDIDDARKEIYSSLYQYNILSLYRNNDVFDDCILKDCLITNDDICETFEVFNNIDNIDYYPQIYEVFSETPMGVKVLKAFKYADDNSEKYDFNIDVDFCLRNISSLTNEFLKRIVYLYKCNIFQRKIITSGTILTLYEFACDDNEVVKIATSVLYNRMR